MKKIDNGVKVTYPQQILLPDQVLKLVLQGVPIISNVLRWDILSKFVNEGYLSGGEVLASIAHTEKMTFIYGSFELSKALEEMVMLGKAGLSDDQFLEYQKQLEKENSAVASATRELVREFILSEGKALSSVLNLLGTDELTKNNYIINAVKNSHSISSFRKTIVKDVTLQYFKRIQLEKTFFKKIENLQQSHYGSAMDVVSDQLTVFYIKLENSILQSKATKDAIYSNPLGKMLIDSLNYPKTGDFTDSERFAFYLDLVKLSTYFLDDVKKPDDPKTRKQLLTNLIKRSVNSLLFRNFTL